MGTLLHDESIRAELASAGMTVQALYSDVTGTPYSESSAVLGVAGHIQERQR